MNPLKSVSYVFFAMNNFKIVGDGELNGLKKSRMIENLPSFCRFQKQQFSL